jgi:hypothetical protein
MEASLFLQTDPIPGGSANAYDYVNQDPLNGLDLAGTCSWWNVYCEAVQPVGHMAVDAVTDPAYLVYWGSLDANGAIHWASRKVLGKRLGNGVADFVGAPLLPGQAFGLGVDAGGDWVKEHLFGVKDYTVGDEGIKNAWLLGSQAGPCAQKYLGIGWRHDFPGIHADGHIDWWW